MDAELKVRLIRITEIGRQLADENPEFDDLGAELCELSGVCSVCSGDGVHPGEDQDSCDDETPISRCPSCSGSGMTTNRPKEGSAS